MLSDVYMFMEYSHLDPGRDFSLFVSLKFLRRTELWRFLIATITAARNDGLAQRAASSSNYTVSDYGGDSPKASEVIVMQEGSSATLLPVPGEGLVCSTGGKIFGDLSGASEAPPFNLVKSGR